MRLLLDKNLSHRLGPILEEHGHDVVHVDDVQLGAADDDVILQRARDDGRIVVSSDTDFGGLLAAQRATAPSVLLTRAIAMLRAPELAALVVSALDTAADALEAGAIVAVGRSDVRVRRLPLR